MPALRLRRKLLLLNILKNEPLTFIELKDATKLDIQTVNRELIDLQKRGLIETFGPKRFRIYLLKNEGLIFLHQNRLHREAEVHNDVADILLGGLLNE